MVRMNFKELIDKQLRVNITCVFGNREIYYDCYVKEVSNDGKFVTIVDKYKKVIILSSDSIKQIKVVSLGRNK